MNAATVETLARTMWGGPPPSFGTGFRGENVIVGIVSTGIDALNLDFRNNDGGGPGGLGTTRILEIWDQTLGTSTSAAGIITAAEINAGTLGGHVDADGRGTHLAGCAAGNGRSTAAGIAQYTYTGMAPKADIVVVKVNTTAPENPNERFASGVMYVWTKATAAGKKAVCIIDGGWHTGRHDGYTVANSTVLGDYWYFTNFCCISGGSARAGILVVPVGDDNEKGIRGKTNIGVSQTKTFTVEVPAHSLAPTTPILSGTCDEVGTATTIKLTGGSASNNVYFGDTIKIVSGTGAGQESICGDDGSYQSYNGTTKIATVGWNGSPTFNPPPDTTSVFQVIDTSVNDKAKFTFSGWIAGKLTPTEIGSIRIKVTSPRGFVVDRTGSGSNGGLFWNAAVTEVDGNISWVWGVNGGAIQPIMAWNVTVKGEQLCALRSGTWTFEITHPGGAIGAYGDVNMWMTSQNLGVDSNGFARYATFVIGRLDNDATLRVPSTAKHVIATSSYCVNPNWINIDGLTQTWQGSVLNDIDPRSGRGPRIDDGVFPSDAEHMRPYVAAPGLGVIASLSANAIGVDRGLVVSATSTTVRLQTTAQGKVVGSADAAIAWRVIILSGTGALDSRKITSWNDGTQTATVDAAWSATPTSSSVYLVVSPAMRPFVLWDGYHIMRASTDAAAAVTAGGIALILNEKATDWTSLWSDENPYGRVEAVRQALLARRKVDVYCGTLPNQRYGIGKLRVFDQASVGGGGTTEPTGRRPPPGFELPPE